jgi:hypothetical protein
MTLIISVPNKNHQCLLIAFLVLKITKPATTYL